MLQSILTSAPFLRHLEVGSLCLTDDDMEPLQPLCDIAPRLLSFKAYVNDSCCHDRSPSPIDPPMSMAALLALVSSLRDIRTLSLNGLVRHSFYTTLPYLVKLSHLHTLSVTWDPYSRHGSLKVDLIKLFLQTAPKLEELTLPAPHKWETVKQRDCEIMAQVVTAGEEAGVRVQFR